jgi:hypothetical protein
VEQEKAKQIKISTKWKKEIGKKGKTKKRLKKCKKYIFTWCPNFVLVMERSGFPLCSMSALGS